MLLSLGRKKKLCKAENPGLDGPDVKRSKISGRQDASIGNVDENIPQNMQKGGDSDFTVDKQFCHLHVKKQKIPRKNRLNLKKVKSASQEMFVKDAGNCEGAHKSPPKFKETHSSMRSVNFKICSNKEASCGEKKPDDQSQQHTNLHLQNCPVCQRDLSVLKCGAEVNDHVNGCLDMAKTRLSSNKFLTAGNEIDVCQICERDMGGYSMIQRLQHINRCCDFVEETKTQALAEQQQVPCLICGKLFKTSKSRQLHMKKCAKVNRVSPGKLVKLKRHENVDIQVGKPVPVESGPSIQKSNLGMQDGDHRTKRKKKSKLKMKNLDEDTQLALALSASLQSSTEDSECSEKMSRKKNKEQKLPALLLRSDDETRKITEARAAAVLYHWADSDEEIQCTPSLVPSSLLVKYGSGSERPSTTDASDQMETTSYQPEISDRESRVQTEQDKNRGNDASIRNKRRENVNDMKGGAGSIVRKDNEAEKSEKTSFNVNFAKQNSNENYLTVDSQARLWRIASLCAVNLSQSGFYVPNLLPEMPPRQKGIISGSEAFEGAENNDISVSDKQNSVKEDDVDGEGITASQEKDIQLLAKLVGDDAQSNISENELKEELEDTWFPSSGFCVDKDQQGKEVRGKESVGRLINDLSSMVGNPLYSDVEIIAKDEEKFYAHSFMLATRCSTLAKLLSKEETTGIGDEKDHNLITLQMSDIGIQAVHAVMTYIYTASFVPVSGVVMEDVRELVQRLNLDCAFEGWPIKDDLEMKKEDASLEGDHFDVDGATDSKEEALNGLLKSLWEGEEGVENGPQEEDNALVNAVLEDELDDMEIKIYTQVTPKKQEDLDVEGRGLELDCYEGEEVANQETFSGEFVLHLECDTDNSSSTRTTCEEGDMVENNVVDHEDPVSDNGDRGEDGDISDGSGCWFVPTTPRSPVRGLTSLVGTHRSVTQCDNETKVLPDGTSQNDGIVSNKATTVGLKEERETQNAAEQLFVSHVASVNKVSGGGDSVVSTSTPTSEHRSTPTKVCINKTPSEHEDWFSSNVHFSPYSPLENIIISPLSSKLSLADRTAQETFAENHGECTGTEEIDCCQPVETECHESVKSVELFCLNAAVSMGKFSAENKKIDSWSDVSVSSSFCRNLSSSERDCGIEKAADDVNFYNSPDIDFYDEGGFNCDIEDYFNVDSPSKPDTNGEQNETEMQERGKIRTIQKLKNKVKSCKEKMPDNCDKETTCEQKRIVGKKRAKLDVEDPRTPMLNYSNMATPDLRAELKQYGVRPLAKRKMIFKLKEIYHYIHRDTVSECETDDEQHEEQTVVAIGQNCQEMSDGSGANEQKFENGTTQDSSESSGSDENCSDDDLSDDLENLSQESSVNLSQRFMALLNQTPDLYLKIVKYEPISLSCFQEILKVNGINCSTGKLKDFLDEQCITFSEPRAARARKRQRRTKLASQKKK